LTGLTSLVVGAVQSDAGNLGLNGLPEVTRLLDLRGNTPSFIQVTDGKLADVNALHLLPAEAGAIDVMDRGYVDFVRLNTMHQAGAFFVTRAKSNMRRRLYSAPADRNAGIACDQTIALGGRQAKQHCPEPLRRLRYNDADTGIAGRWNCSSSGSSSTCGSSGSMAPLRSR
jgi:hypothetical protein